MLAPPVAARRSRSCRLVSNHTLRALEEAQQKTERAGVIRVLDQNSYFIAN